MKSSEREATLVADFVFADDIKQRGDDRRECAVVRGRPHGGGTECF